MNLYQKPKAILGKYEVNEIAYFSQEHYSKNYRAVASPFGILICDASTGEERHLLPSPNNEVLSVACSPEGNIIAGGKTDNTIQLWDLEEGYDRAIKKHILKGHGGGVTSVVFSPDGRMLASGSNDGTIRLWDASDGYHKSTINHDGVASVVFSPDGRMLASGSSDGTIRLWESEIRFGQNRCIATLDEPKIDVYPTIFIDNNSRKAVTAVVFSPNDSILASGYSDGTIYLWDIRTLIPFVKRDSDKDRLFWYTNRDLSKNRINLEKKHTDSIQSLDFSSDGRTLASGSKDKTICMWDTKAAQHLVTLQKHTSTVFSVVFQDEQLVSESSDGSIRFWNTETGKNEKTLIGGYIGNIESVVFSPDSQMLASIGTRGKHTIIYFWDINTGEMKKTSIAEEMENLKCDDYFTSDSETSQTITIKQETKQYGLPYSYDRRKLTAIHLLDINTGEPKATIAEKIENLEFVQLSPDSKMLLTIGDIGYGEDTNQDQSSKANFHLWDVNTGKLKTTMAERIKNFKSATFNPDSKTLLTIEEYRDYDKQINIATLRLWDVDTGELKATIAEKIENLESVNFIPDIKTLLTIGSEEKTDRYRQRNQSSRGILRLWDVDTGELKKGNLEFAAFKRKLKYAPEEMINNIEFIILNSDKTKFASVHSDNLIRLWDVETGKHQSTFTGAQEDIASVAFSLDNRTLACGTRNGMILLWDIAK